MRWCDEAVSGCQEREGVGDDLIKNGCDQRRQSGVKIML